MRYSEVKMLKGLLPYLIMKCAEAQAFHGYALIKLMRKRFGVYVGASTMYPLLTLLESEGLLTSEWNTHTTDTVKHPCKVYTITEDGRRAVDALTLTMQRASTFTGQIQEPKRPERYNNVITLNH